MDNKLSRGRLMKRIFTKENIIGLLLLLAAVAAFCAFMLIEIFSGKNTDNMHHVGNWQDRELPLSEGGLLVIRDRTATLYDEKGKAFWSTKDLTSADDAVAGKQKLPGDQGNYLVQNGLVTDIDGNGNTEVLLLLWKIGKYGKHRPFWETDEDTTYSQHLFIYEVTADKEVRQKWCTSDVGREIVRFKLMEKNNSILLVEDIKGACTLWRWQDFGLKMIENGASILAFGDNIIHREIYEYADTNEAGDFSFLYEPFLEDIQSADIAVFQQESMLVGKDSAVSGYPAFGSPLSVGEAISRAGFDVACCAGNHAIDKGTYGIDVTTDFYRKNNVLTIGVQRSDDEDYRPYETVNRNGISFALMDYTYGVGAVEAREELLEKYPYAVHFLPRDEEAGDREELYDEESLLADIKKAKENSDFVVVFVHWGDEYKKDISDYQKRMTALLAKGGADLVIGTHPHVVQEVETVKRPDGGDMLVFYSLGNFRAYQGQSEDTKVGGEAVIKVEHCYDGVRIADYELKEIYAFAPQYP